MLSNNANKPPDTSPVSYDELRQWELGLISLSPEQLVGALALQQELYEGNLQTASAV
ncbi:MAG TPA: hypothetical protein VGE30_03085 [Candidatus Saccharimonadales bacterium]